MIDFFNDFDKINKKETPKPEPEKQDASEKQGEQAEEKEESADFSKTLESLRNEITALKELLKNSYMGNSADDSENKTESEEDKE